jgi:hypothetical protein
MPKYKVEWKELVTYSVEVEADDEFEAQDVAQCDYGNDDEVNCNYYDGTMKVERLDYGI